MSALIAAMTAAKTKGKLKSKKVGKGKKPLPAFMIKGKNLPPV